MLTLFIAVGLYYIQCIGSNCYPVTQETVEILKAAGLLEMIYEIKGVIAIWRKKGR